MVDLSKISISGTQLPLDPRDIYMALSEKEPGREYPRDVQTDVWKQWESCRDSKNVIIKMNTGSGKTTVGLIVLQSCLNEKKGPAVYVVPHSYLVDQVALEARKLGIRIVFSEDEYLFREGKAILVINIHKLINGKSVFGMRPGGNNCPIGSIVIDDVHASMDTIEDQFSVCIPESNQAYRGVNDILGESLKAYDAQRYFEVIENGDRSKSILVPFWIWQNRNLEVLRLLQNEDYAENDFVLFNLPLLLEDWRTCNCVITPTQIEISPKCIPISIVKSFENAQHRVFMSATLSDDSVFVSTMGLEEESLSKIIAPEKANDLGERMILYPQLLNPQIDDDELRTMLIELSKTYNTAVIVPSKVRSQYWFDVADQTLTKDNLAEGVDKMRSGHVGLSVFVNQYDGVDLPGDACRILVIDGLPSTRSEYESILESINYESNHIRRAQIHKIEQGMGRGVRSSSDHCVVVIMGKKIANIIAIQNGIQFLSSATKAQYELSKQLWDQLSELGRPQLSCFVELMDLSLRRDKDWVELGRRTISSVYYDRVPKLDRSSVAQRSAFERARIDDYPGAVKILENEKNIVDNLAEKGYLMQLMAEYENFTNRENAQQMLLAAKGVNRAVLTPISGIRYEKTYSHSNSQSASVLEYISSKGLNPISFVLKANDLLDALCFGDVSSNRFEEALKETFQLLGFCASRPENESKVGPDNLVAVGDMEYLVIECKNRSITGMIDESDCSQLNNSIVWFCNEYPDECVCRPIMIHNSDIFDRFCSPDSGIRVVIPSLLDLFKSSVKDFVIEISHSESWCNVSSVAESLKNSQLRKSDLINHYSKKFRQQR